MINWNTMPSHVIQENRKSQFKVLLKEHLLAVLDNT